MREHQDLVLPIDSAIETAQTELGALQRQVADLRVELRRLKGARRILAGSGAGRRSVSASPAHLAAGPAAIETVANILSEAGRTTQAEVAREAGKNSGTISHALAALAEQGKAMKTGRTHRNSPEWAWVPVEGDGAAEAEARTA